MTPEQIAALGDIAREIMHPLNEFLIEDICRRVAKAGKITSTAEYKTYRAAALGASEDALRETLKKQGVLNDRSIRELMRYLVENTIAFENNAALQRMVDGYVKVAKKQMGAMMSKLGIRAPTGEVVPIGRAYRDAMDFAFRQVFTGATDYNTALRQATHKLAADGIRHITAGGPKSRTLSIEYATRQNLMTQMGELDMEIVRMNHDVLGCNGWEISAHTGSAPDHEPIQGLQYSDAEFEKLNNSLKRRIGTLSCGHWVMPIRLGVNSPQYSRAQLAQMRRDNERGVDYQGRHYTLYEASQRRNDIESGIRNLKNQILIDRSLGDSVRLRENEISLVRMQEEYKRFCKRTGQLTQTERLQVAGFGRSEAAAAQAAMRRLAA